MKILIKENHQFGGYVWKLVDDNLIHIKLSLPFNVGHTGYTGRDVTKIINQWKNDAEVIFNISDLEVIHDY